MTQNKKLDLDCPQCGGPLEVVQDHGESVVTCMSCHQTFGDWHEFKRAFIDPQQGQSQDRLRKEHKDRRR